MDTTTRGRDRGNALEVDVMTADRTHHPLCELELSARHEECVAVGTRLSQQGARLRPLIGDCRAFGIVLVIRGDQLGSLNDAGDDGLERCNLTACPLLLGLDDLQEAPDVERVHVDSLTRGPAPQQPYTTRRMPDPGGVPTRRSVRVSRAARIRAHKVLSGGGSSGR